jgi:LmbE family N-acetylglucosaminyl deacetylase
MSECLLVIAPHPDDELLGSGAIMLRHRERGGALAVVIATDGSRSDTARDPAALAAQRREECSAGLITLLGECPPILFIDACDGALDAARVNLERHGRLARFLDAYPPDTIIVTDPADAHRDHKAAFGLAARIIAAGHGERLYVVPISQRIDQRFDPAAYETLAVGRHAAAKAAAVARHESQLNSRSGFALSTAVLNPIMTTEYLRLAHDRADAACGVVSGEHFEALFAASPDPWGYEVGAYERDRFARTVAALSGRRYTRALELGCANGALSEQLAPLCDALVALDTSTMALAHARARLAGAPHVSFSHARLPHQLPAGPFDLIVASDMLYYLGLRGVIALAAGLRAQAAPHARLLIASYLGETETRLTGEMASEALIAMMGWWRRVHAERTAQLRIDVLEQP